jgi:hypothetical protein
VLAWADPAEVLAEAQSAYDGPVELVGCGSTYVIDGVDAAARRDGVRAPLGSGR